MTNHAQSVQLRTGVELEYVEHGDPSGVPVLLAHGGIDSWHSYERVMPHLPASMRVIAPSLRGQGESSKPRGGYRPSEMAGDVLALLDALEVDAAVVVGHSSSSLIAQRFAIDRPRRTLGMVLIGGFATMRDKPITHELREAVLELTDPVDPGFVREFQESTIAQEVPKAFVDKIVSESKTPAHVWQGLNAGVLAEDCAGELNEITAPTMIVWGQHDAASPHSDQQALASAIPNARLVVYEHAGHSLHWEEPERFAADLRAFVESLEPARTSGRA